jgi:hypothetical protein
MVTTKTVCYSLFFNYLYVIASVLIYFKLFVEGINLVIIFVHVPSFSLLLLIILHNPDPFSFFTVK